MKGLRTRTVTLSFTVVFKSAVARVKHAIANLCVERSSEHWFVAGLVNLANGSVIGRAQRGAVGKFGHGSPWPRVRHGGCAGCPFRQTANESILIVSR